MKFKPLLKIVERSFFELSDKNIWQRESLKGHKPHILIINHVNKIMLVL
jgi:hypothetical protein